jgi:predicted amidohydrolase YtcJ
VNNRLLIGRISDIGVPGRVARALWIVGDRIRAVGNDEIVRQAIDSGAKIEEYGDRYIGPGFVDPHAHVEVGSVALETNIDCRVPAVSSIEDLLQLLAENRRQGSEDWILGQANLFWDMKLADKRYPTRQELDVVSSTQPIAIRAGGHFSVLNSRALELSGVAQYAKAEGMMGRAIVQRDASGEPTGLIGELDAALPLPNPSGNALTQILSRGIRQLFTRYGVTAVGEITETPNGPVAFDELMTSGTPPLRASVYLWSPGAFSLESACNWQESMSLSSHEKFLRIQGVKVFADGGFSSRNAATYTPYRPRYALTPGSRGEINLSKSEIISILAKTLNAGLQLAIHTNGERAQLEAAAAIAEVPVASIRGPLRTRLEHAGNYVTSARTIDAWLESGVHIVPQPGFLYNFGDFIPEFLGKAGETGRHPFRSLLDRGIRLSGSSDLHLGSEIEQTNPLFGVWNCIKRESFRGNIIEPEESIGLDEALRMHTLDAAAVLGREDDIGSLEESKFADVVVFDEDPHDVTVDQLREIRVDKVLVGGATVYERDGAQPAAARTLAFQ